MAQLLLPRPLGRLPVTDVALAAALCVLALGGLLTGQVRETPFTVTIPIAVISTLAVAVRTRFPIAVAGVFAVLSVTQGLLANHSSQSLWSLVVWLVVSYTVASERDEGWALVGLTLVLGNEFLCQWLDHGSDYAFATLVGGGVWLFGRGTRSWRNRATYAEQHRHDLARLAVVEERTRIARELHDVVAHSLSVIAVQANAAEAALDKDPHLAGPPMRVIRDSAGDALTDMRQLLHVLRDGEVEGVADDLTPAHGINDINLLVARMRASGLPVEADIRVGDALSSGLELAVFRIAQEGLTNVRKHAGDVPTRLLVARENDELRVEVHNEQPPQPASATALSSGYGLVGTQERVKAAGGTLDVGPSASGGFDMIVRLPVHPVEAARP